MVTALVDWLVRLGAGVLFVLGRVCHVSCVDQDRDNIIDRIDISVDLEEVFEADFTEDRLSSYGELNQ